jgi:hypothetical protein
LHWPSEYELKEDKISLTDTSATRYLEELLTYTRRALERKRTYSSTSSESVTSASSASKRTSTPLKDPIPVKEASIITQGIEYEKEKEI